MPIIRPDASRVVACTVPPVLFWRSMVWIALPDASRTTSRQVWARAGVARTNDNRTGKSMAFMVGETEVGSWSFGQNAKIIPLSPFKIPDQNFQHFSTHPRYLSHPTCYGGMPKSSTPLRPLLKIPQS